MKNAKLLSSYKLGSIELKNRIVMAPMTRSRAIVNQFLSGLNVMYMMLIKEMLVAIAFKQ